MRTLTRDLLTALGMRRATSDWMPRVLFGFGAGLVVGAATALILTPKSGTELRSELATGANRLVRKGREQIDQIRQRVESARAGTEREEIQPGV